MGRGTKRQPRRLFSPLSESLPLTSYCSSLAEYSETHPVLFCQKIILSHLSLPFFFSDGSPLMSGGDDELVSHTRHWSSGIHPLLSYPIIEIGPRPFTASGRTKKTPSLVSLLNNKIREVHIGDLSFTHDSIHPRHDLFSNPTLPVHGSE